MSRTWYDGTYDYGSKPEQGPPFFLGGAAADERSHVVVIGGVKRPDGWLLFSQLPSLYDSPEEDREEAPHTVEDYRSECGSPSMPAEDSVYEMVFQMDCTGWEWDVVEDALKGSPGYVAMTIPAMSPEQAKQALVAGLASLLRRV